MMELRGVAIRTIQKQKKILEAKGDSSRSKKDGKGILPHEDKEYNLHSTSR
jgi:hypothetical protein